MTDYDRDFFVRERRDSTDRTLRHEHYGPLGLLVTDRVVVRPSDETRETLERCLPGHAAALWDSVLSADRDTRAPGHNANLDVFLHWFGPEDPEGFPWGIIGEYSGIGKHEMEENDAPCPFDRTMLLVFGYGYVCPGDIVRVNRMLGFGWDGSGYEEILGEPYGPTSDGRESYT